MYLQASNDERWIKSTLIKSLDHNRKRNLGRIFAIDFFLVRNSTKRSIQKMALVCILSKPSPSSHWFIHLCMVLSFFFLLPLSLTNRFFPVLLFIAICFFLLFFFKIFLSFPRQKGQIESLSDQSRHGYTHISQ